MNPFNRARPALLFYSQMKINVEFAPPLIIVSPCVGF